LATFDEVTTPSDEDATNRTGKTSLNFALNIKALGIGVPPVLIALADEVIE